MTSLLMLPDIIKARQEAEEEEKTLRGRAVAAGLENRVRTTGNMNIDDFQNQFRQGVSPAREILANMMGGVSSKLMGTQFKPLRQRVFEEYEKQEKLKQSEEKMVLLDQQKQQAEQRLMTVAQIASKDRQDATAARREGALMRNAVAEGRLDVAQQMAKISEDKYLLDKDKWEMMGELDAQLRMARTRNAGAGAFEEAGESLIRQGLDPTDPDFITRQLKLAEEINKTKPIRPRQGPGPNTGPVKDVVNAFGETDWVRVSPMGPIKFNRDAQTWEPVKGAIRNYSDAEQKVIRDNFAAAEDGRRIAAFVLQNPQSVRTMGQAWATLAPQWTNLSGVQDPKELGVANLMGNALATRVRSYSGAQVTDQERGFFEKLSASPLDTPRNAVSKAFVTSVIQDAAAIRDSLNINAKVDDVLDFGAVMSDVLAMIEKADKLGRLQNLRLPSRRTIVEEAARAKGRTAVFDNQGRVVGVR